MPIPGNPLGYTLVYALESAGGPVLVDAGWSHPDAWAALSSGLAAIGMDVAGVRGVVVTHHHPDHAGLAGRVREASGAWIAMHEADARIVRLFRQVVADGTHRGFQAGMLRRAGADEDETAEVLGEVVDPPAAPDRDLADGELVDLPGRRLRAIWTPGHSPGHICLHLEDADRLFTGDHVLPGITPHIGLFPLDDPDADPLGEFLSSLARIASLGELEALPAHQWTFHGTAARAREIADHHEERLAELLDVLGEAARPLTLWETARGMRWNKPWEELPPVLRRLAAAEAAAHLRLLERRGRASRTDGDGTLFYSLT
ncbi:MBL fold metallo-hydrolase [Bailinhaonella thermotolerans]|uniref:MBL fold metallo-hydrolase n=1 Tax=Bailinhaonella thermotolerans TaxID=1070861 RepID=UPI001F5B9BB3|nr:MBL fold metallo-hydrolase [Bailinhaonella thermotolerans]